MSRREDTLALRYRSSGSMRRRKVAVNEKPHARSQKQYRVKWVTPKQCCKPPRRQLVHERDEHTFKFHPLAQDLAFYANTAAT